MHMPFVNQADRANVLAAVGAAESANVPGQGTGHQLNGTDLEQATPYLTNKKHVLILIPFLLSPTCCQASPDLRICAGPSDVSFCFLLFFFLFSQNSRGGRGEDKRKVRFVSGVSSMHGPALKVRGWCSMRTC